MSKWLLVLILGSFGLNSVNAQPATPEQLEKARELMRRTLAGETPAAPTPAPAPAVEPDSPAPVAPPAPYVPAARPANPTPAAPPATSVPAARPASPAVAEVAPLPDPVKCPDSEPQPVPAAEAAQSNSADVKTMTTDEEAKARQLLYEKLDEIATDESVPAAAPEQPVASARPSPVTSQSAVAPAGKSGSSKFLGVLLNQRQRDMFSVSYGVVPPPPSTRSMARKPNSPPAPPAAPAPSAGVKAADPSPATAPLEVASARPEKEATPKPEEKAQEPVQEPEENSPAK